MDLFKADPRKVADLIYRGRLEIGEVPSGARAQVNRILTELREAEVVAELKAKKEAKPAKKTAKAKEKANASKK